MSAPFRSRLGQALGALCSRATGDQSEANNPGSFICDALAGYSDPRARIAPASLRPAPLEYGNASENCGHADEIQPPHRLTHQSRTYDESHYRREISHARGSDRAKSAHNAVIENVSEASAKQAE